MDYLQNTLGIKVKKQRWSKAKQLPYFLVDKYRMEIVYLDDMKTLFLYPKEKLDPLPTVKKHIAKFLQIEKIPIVLALVAVTKQQRQYLITDRIPFVVDQKQIYLPFLGTVLTEQYTIHIPFADKLQPSTQELFLYFLYQNQQKLYANTLTKTLNISAMTVTRALRQLVKTGNFEIQKDGTQNVLIAKMLGKDLYERMKPFLINPVRRVCYIPKERMTDMMLLAGETALAQQSMMNGTEIETRAVYGKLMGKALFQEELIDQMHQIRLELWKYDPCVLSQHKMVDPISLVLSLSDDNDERTELAIDAMLNQFWRRLDGQGN